MHIDFAKYLSLEAKLSERELRKAVEPLYTITKSTFVRQFINKEGKFIITLPIDWYHKNKLFEAKDTDPDSFEFLNEPIGTFQLSLTTKDKGLIPKIIEKHNIKSQELGRKNLVFAQEFFPSSRFDMFLWFVLVGEQFFMAKYIYDAKNREKEIIKKEVDKAKKALETLIFVEEEIRELVLAHFQFDKFMFSLASSQDLTSKAYKDNKPIELVVLLANQIDAGLRLALILNEQIETKSLFIDIKLIQQKEGDKVVMEKAIYKLALEKGIIDEQLNLELHDLYNKRNKVIHQYIISDITTKEVKKISIEYSLMEKRIGEIIKELEKRQLEEKVGIYGKNPADSPLTKEQEVYLQNAIDEKHADYSFIKSRVEE